MTDPALAPNAVRVVQISDCHLRSVPGTVMAFSPVHWSDNRLYQVTPRPRLKYFGFGPA